MEKLKINGVIEGLFEKRDTDSLDKVLNNFEAKNRGFYLAEIEDDTGIALDMWIRFWNKLDEENEVPINEREPIKVYISSYGGVLTATLTCIDAIKNSKTPVWTINTGTAYSGGFFIAISGHKRYSYPNSSFLFHEGSTGMGGDANKFQNFADFYKRQRNRLKSIVLDYTKVTSEEYDAKSKDDWWFMADEALSYGLTDEIINEVI